MGSVARSNRGFTLVELSVALVIIGVLSLGAYRAGEAAVQEARIKRVVSELHAIAGAAQSVRSRVESASVDASDFPLQGQYTYASFGPGDTMADLNAKADRSFPVASPWGTDYEFEAIGQRATASVVVPIEGLEVAGASAKDNGDGTTTLSVTARGWNSQQTGPARSDRATLFEEPVR